MEVSNSLTVTSTNTAVKVLDVPSGYVAYLRGLILSNGATATAKVTVMSGDGTAGEDYVILIVRVPPGGNVVLDRNVLASFKAIKSIYVVTDQQPLDVSISAEIM